MVGVRHHVGLVTMDPHFTSRRARLALQSPARVRVADRRAVGVGVRLDHRRVQLPSQSAGSTSSAASDTPMVSQLSPITEGFPLPFRFGIRTPGKVRREVALLSQVSRALGDTATVVELRRLPEVIGGRPRCTGNTSNSHTPVTADVYPGYNYQSV